jgi:hypothetical protein
VQKKDSFVGRTRLEAADEQTASLSKPFSSKIDVPNVQYDRRHTGNHDGITDFVRRRVSYLLHEPSEERGTGHTVGQESADFPTGASEASEMLPGNVLPWVPFISAFFNRTGPGTRPGGTRSRAAATCVEQRRWKGLFSPTSDGARPLASWKNRLELARRRILPAALTVRNRMLVPRHEFALTFERRRPIVRTKEKPGSSSRL